MRGAQNYYLWEHLVASLQRIGIGVGAAILFGIPLGLLMSTVRWVGIVVEPYLNFLRSLPPLGYIGLLIVWFGIGDLSKIWLLFLAAFPPIAMATISGVRGIREDQINAVLTLGASRRQAVTRVMVPSILPEVINGIRVATGFAWTTVVAAELNNGIPGIGGLAYLSGTQLDTPLTIACIIVIGVAAVALDGLSSSRRTCSCPGAARPDPPPPAPQRRHRHVAKHHTTATGAHRGPGPRPRGCGVESGRSATSAANTKCPWTPDESVTTTARLAWQPGPHR